MDPLSMERAMIKNMIGKTGKSLEEWITIVKKQNFSKHLFYISILFLCLYDYTRINHEIISPKKHIPHKKIIQPEEYLDSYLHTPHQTTTMIY